MKIVTGYEDIDEQVNKGSIIAFEASGWEGPMFLSKPTFEDKDKFKVVSKFVDRRQGPPLGSMWNNSPGPMEDLTVYRVKNIVTGEVRKFTTHPGWDFSLSQVILL